VQSKLFIRNKFYILLKRLKKFLDLLEALLLIKAKVEI